MSLQFLSYQKEYFLSKELDTKILQTNFSSVV